MNRYKKGDRVKIIRLDAQSISEMKYTVGKIGVVISSYNSECKTIRVKVDKHTWSYYVTSIRPAKLRIG